jgi:hypothetical protein
MIVVISQRCSSLGQIFEQIRLADVYVHYSDAQSSGGVYNQCR